MLWIGWLNGTSWLSLIDLNLGLWRQTRARDDSETPTVRVRTSKRPMMHRREGSEQEVSRAQEWKRALHGNGVCSKLVPLQVPVCALLQICSPLHLFHHRTIPLVVPVSMIKIETEVCEYLTLNPTPPPTITSLIMSHGMGKKKREMKLFT